MMAENWGEMRLKEGKKKLQGFKLLKAAYVSSTTCPAMPCNARSRAPRGQIKPFVVVAVRSAAVR